MRSWIPFAFLLVLIIAAVSCGGDGGGTTFTSGGGTTGGSTLRTVSGQALLRLAMAIQPSEQQIVLDNKAAIENAGHIVASDGSAVYWPDQAAVNYVVTYNGQRFVTDANGLFQLQVSNSTPATGTIQHPTDTNQILTFDVAQLTSSGAAGQIFFKTIYSPCSMTAGPTDICSGQPPAAAQPTVGKSALRASIEPNTFNHSQNQAPPTFTAVFGSVIVNYPSRDISLLNPNGNTCVGLPPLTSCSIDGTNSCEQFNGILTDKGISNPSWYLGSTCDQRVRSGLCPNENFLSDVEQNVIDILGSPLTNTPLINALFEDDPQPPGTTGNPFVKRIHCYDNHGGRPCQEIVPGDLAVQVNGTAVAAKPGVDPPPNLEVTVSPGDVITLKVHNNGNWGVTNVQQTQNQLGGTLSVPSQARPPAVGITGSLTGPGPTLVDNGATILHYDSNIRAQRLAVDHTQTDPNFYYTDVTVKYTVPSTLPDEGSDVFKFFTDGSNCTVTFKKGATTTNPVSGTYSGTLSGSATETTSNSACAGTVTLSGTVTVTVPDGDVGGSTATMNITQSTGICQDYSGAYPQLFGLVSVFDPLTLEFITNKRNGDPTGLLDVTFAADGKTATAVWTIDDPSPGVKGSSTATLAK